MFDRILVPLDGTDFAEAALAPARELARAFHARILLVRAIGYTQRPPRTAEEDVQTTLERLNDADAYVHELTSSLRKAGYEADFALCVAEPGAGIADAIEFGHADLIVMAAHPHTDEAWRNDMSTLYQVLARANVPVLVWREHTIQATRATRQRPDQLRPPSIAPLGLRVP